MTQKTKSQLQAELLTNLPDNTTGLITPAIFRQTQTDILDSVPTLDTLPFVNVRNFGAKGDDVTDDLPAFNAALAYLKSIQLIVGSPSLAGPSGRLFIPAGKYFLSGPLNVHLPVYMYGTGGGEGTINPGTLLRFAQNQWGIVFHEYRTLDNGGGNAAADAGLGQAAGSTLEGLTVWGGGAQSVNGPYTNAANTNRACHGVLIRAPFVKCIDVSTAFWGGNGFNINATSGTTGVTAGNANGFAFYHCLAEFNAMDGFSLSGSDANTGVVISCHSLQNGACGFREYSFLGNTYVQCHTRGNGIGDPIVSGALGGTCTFSGHRYYIPGATNGNSQETSASTTTPGTNSAVWAPDDGIVSVPTGPPIWITGQTWRISGPYVTQPGNTNAKNVFLGCYAELGQAPSQSTYPTLWVGGVVGDNGFDTSGTPGVTLFGSSAGIQSDQGFVGKSSDTTKTLRYASSLDVGNLQTVVAGQDNTPSTNWTWYYDNTSKLILQHQHSVNSETWGLSNDARPYSHAFSNLIIATPSNVANGVRLSSCNVISDLNGLVVAQGDRFVYTGSTRPSGMGAICTTAGTVGSGAVLTEFGEPVLTTTFANLPTTPRLGQTASINNCSTQVWGANADGAGALYVKVNWNGTNWTVIGK